MPCAWSRALRPGQLVRKSSSFQACAASARWTRQSPIAKTRRDRSAIGSNCRTERAPAPLGAPVGSFLQGAVALGLEAGCALGPREGGFRFPFPRQALERGANDDQALL